MIISPVNNIHSILLSPFFIFDNLARRKNKKRKMKNKRGLEDLMDGRFQVRVAGKRYFGEF